MLTFLGTRKQESRKWIWKHLKKLSNNYPKHTIILLIQSTLTKFPKSKNILTSL